MILGLLQARTSSRRLPGKVLKSILGVPMLEHQLQRITRAQSIHTLVVATSAQPEDDAIEALCHGLEVECFRGDQNDVLDRLYQASLPYQPAHVVRLTGDCPLTDPTVIDAVIAAHLSHSNDYTSNTLCPTFPDGLDVEVLRFSALKTAWQEASLPSHREHVTSFIYQHASRFRLENVHRDEDLSSLRWTVDEPEDLDFIREVYNHLYPNLPNFGTEDVLNLLRSHPQIATQNKRFLRNEGYFASLKRDPPSKAPPPEEE
jgi:spore coat polysaccharide biosynthesis protein SpsF